MKTKNQAANALKEIMSELNDGVIKDYEMPTLCNLETCEDTGFAVILTLSTKFEYPNCVLDEWRNKLGADDFMISVNRNKLQVKFNVRY